MKQFLYGSVVACMSLATMVGFSSCSDDDDDYNIEIPSSVSSSLTADGLSGIYSFPIEANGSWTASVVTEDDDEDETTAWVYVLDSKGKNDGTIRFSIDDNSDGIARQAVIRVTNGDKFVDYKVYQTPAATNATSDAQYASSGLGHGVEMSPQSNSGSSFFTISSFINLRNFADSARLSQVPSVVSAENSSLQSYQLTTLSEYNAAASEIKATLKVDVSFGLFKLGLSGSFKMYGSDADTNLVFQAVINNPYKTLTMDYEVLTQNYLIPTDDKLKEDSATQARRALIFSANFLNLHDQIEDLVAQGAKFDSLPAAIKLTKNETDKQKQLDYKLYKKLLSLYRNYSPMMVYKSTVGGYVNVDYVAKQVNASDTMEIHGKLTASFSSTFSLKAEATADYFNDTKAFSKGAEMALTICGGTPAAQDSLFKTLGTLIGTDTLSVPALIDAASAWKTSISAETAVPTTFEAVPIWKFFTEDEKNKDDEDETARGVVRNFMMAKYPNKADGSCPYTYDLQKLGEQQ
jgi:hypothetical protein